MLKIKNLSVTVKGKPVLQRLNLKIKKGEIHALLGPNASGKSSLAHTLMGFPEYQVTEGNIYFKNKEIVNLAIEERVKLGMVLVWQHPPVVKGVKLGKLIDRIAKQPIDIDQFSWGTSLVKRELNHGFSGGEKKLSEILQIVSLRPSLVIFDELDSGLDIKNLTKMIKVIKEELVKNRVSLLLITHHGEILNFLKPDIAHVMLEKEIICSSDNWRKVWQTIRRFDYEKCRQCELSSSQ